MAHGQNLPQSLAGPAGLMLILGDAAEQALRRQMRALRHRFRRRIEATLRPGEHTPLWNELVKQAQPYLRKRGSKTELARILRIPRQRVHDCLKAKTACLDAERALLLLCWVSVKQQNKPWVL